MEDEDKRFYDMLDTIISQSRTIDDLFDKNEKLQSEIKKYQTNMIYIMSMNSKFRDFAETQDEKYQEFYEFLKGQFPNVFNKIDEDMKMPMNSNLSSNTSIKENGELQMLESMHLLDAARVIIKKLLQNKNEENFDNNEF